MTNNASLFDETDLSRANRTLQVIPFYPADEVAQASIAEFLARICPHRTALLWLVDTLVERMPAWTGLPDVRGLLCCRYRPADGVEGTCCVAGFTPRDGESRQIMAHENFKAVEGAKSPLRITGDAIVVEGAPHVGPPSEYPAFVPPPPARADVRRSDQARLAADLAAGVPLSEQQKRSRTIEIEAALGRSLPGKDSGVRPPA